MNLVLFVDEYNLKLFLRNEWFEAFNKKRDGSYWVQITVPKESIISHRLYGVDGTIMFKCEPVDYDYDEDYDDDEEV